MKNNDDGSCMKTKRMFVGLLAMLPWVKLFANANRVLEIPFEFPLNDLSQAGQVESVEFICPQKPATGILSPSIEPRDKYTWGMFLQFKFNENDENDRLRVQRLVGGTYYDGDFKKRNGRLVQNAPGLPVLLNINVTSISTSKETVVYNKKIKVGKKISSGGGNFDRVIDDIQLAPGRYRLDVENVEEHPELKNTRISLRISYRTGK